MAKICAHQGFSERYPENTVLAIESAVDLGAEMIVTSPLSMFYKTSAYEVP